MLNVIWILMVVAAVVCGAIYQKLGDVSAASVDAAGSAVELAIGLVGVMALWLGLMRVLQEAGILKAIARGLRPIMTRLFPDVPADHPAMSMMILNITSNMLGLGNAATPFGIKAMMELNKLNKTQGTATNAMALFLAINTSNLALLPTGVIGMRAGLGSQAAGSILLTTILATACSTLVAIIVAKSLQGLPAFVVKGGPTADSGGAFDGDGPSTDEAQKVIDTEAPGATPEMRWLSIVLGLAVVGAFAYAFWDIASVDGVKAAAKTAVSSWALVFLLVVIVLFGMNRGVKVYDAVVQGGKEGFQVALTIIPFLVAILVAVGMLRASGAIDLLTAVLQPSTSLIGMPAETLPMALLRPLSGSGAYGIAAEIMQTHGPDSLIGNIVSTMQGSTETTFYVLAVYFGAVQVKNVRHTVAACLTADLAGVLAAVYACRLLLA